jgi:hypothetical protein
MSASKSNLAMNSIILATIFYEKLPLTSAIVCHNILEYKATVAIF